MEPVEIKGSKRTRGSARDEAPLLDDLAAVGVEVNSVWRLYTVPDAYPTVIPVLLSHVQRDYRDRVLEGIGIALAHKTARGWWSELKHLYLTAENPVVRDRLAAALSEVAVREHYDDLLGFIRDPRLGATRVYFLRDINRIGNRMAPGAGRAEIESLADDPVLGREATAILKGRSRNQ